MSLSVSMYRMTVITVTHGNCIKAKTYTVEKFTEFLWCIVWALSLQMPKSLDLAF